MMGIIGFGYCAADLMPWAMIGEVIDEDGVEVLSKTPGRKELQAMVMQGFFGPVSDFAKSMDDLLTEVHGLVEALHSKQSG